MNSQSELIEKNPLVQKAKKSEFLTTSRKVSILLYNPIIYIYI